METIAQDIAQICKDVFDVSIVPIMSRPDEQFGDYSTNIALQLGKQLGQSPIEVAEAIKRALQSDNIAHIEVAGPGFINITLSDKALLDQLRIQPKNTLKGKVVVAEYSDPNPFKVLHAGHLYTSVVGDAIANLLETAGAHVHRVNFGGDVGLHVGKTMWVILQRLGGENPDKLSEVTSQERSMWLSECYIEGTSAYEDDERAKSEIVDLNKRIYQIHTDNDHDSPLAKIYWTTRQWSYDYFNEFYAQIGSHFEKYYPESETAALGLQTVREHIPEVFQESHGAVIFDGETHGLHTRVFINSEGLPTYEAKDVGLIMLKWQDYHFDTSIVITGNEQLQYMAVVLKAVEQFEPNLTHATKHLTHGMVRLAGGVKMSSRKGNILAATDVLQAASKANQANNQEQNDAIELGAVKYAFLKQRIGGDIVYDPVDSVNVVGNSGPYLQYSHARADSILAKAKTESMDIPSIQLQPDERSLTRKLGEYSEVVDQAIADLMPHYICTYLYELAQVFNRFYEHNRVLEDERQALRLNLVSSYADVLNNGLNLLNIPAPERM